MRILLVAERYYPEVGAAPSRLTNMADGLRQHGAEVDVLTSLPNYPKGRIYDGYRGRICKHEVINGGEVFRYWAYATVSKSAFKRALNMISFAITIWLFSFKIRRCRSYDSVIIQTPTLFVATSAMWLFKGLYKRKCILNVSDIWPSTAVDMGAMKENSRAYKAMLWCEKYLYRKADGIIGQSHEILNHIASYPCTERRFLYRNLQRYKIEKEYRLKGEPLKIAFAGMLGVAQDVYAIVQNIDFKTLGVEFHIIGGGNQFEVIKKYVEEHPDSNVYMHGIVPKEKMPEIYANIDVSIVPLMVRIQGAFPSKILDILPMGIPILFCGGGEGAEFVTSHHVGYVSDPGDYNGLKDNILKMKNMSSEEYQDTSANCIRTTCEELDFEKQIEKCYEWLKEQ